LLTPSTKQYVITKIIRQKINFTDRFANEF